MSDEDLARILGAIIAAAIYAAIFGSLLWLVMR